jgi:hypothetical protein
MTYKPLFRVGDRARIITPRFVVRVGYPKVIEDYLPQVDAVDTDLLAILKKLTYGADRDYLKINLVPNQILEHRVVKRIKRDLAYMIARGDGFGGRERMLHCQDIPEATGEVVEVTELRTALTGTYYPPRSYEDDWEPGGLNNEVRHRLAKVDWLRGGLFEPLDWIEITNLEKVA